MTKGCHWEHAVGKFPWLTETTALLCKLKHNTINFLELHCYSQTMSCMTSFEIWTEYSNLHASFELCSRDSEFPLLFRCLDISKIVTGSYEHSFCYKINSVWKVKTISSIWWIIVELLYILCTPTLWKIFKIPFKSVTIYPASIDTLKGEQEWAISFLVELGKALLWQGAEHLKRNLNVHFSLVDTGHTWNSLTVKDNFQHSIEAN